MTQATREDAILPMTNDYMQQIVSGQKNYEFRRYRITETVRRIWFYITAPTSSIAYICEIEPARARNPEDEKLVEDGLGNKEFNDRHRDWDRYDYAYRILSVYKLSNPIKLSQLKSRYGVKSAPRSIVYLPPKIFEDVPWNNQERILPRLCAQNAVASVSSPTNEDGSRGGVKRKAEGGGDDICSNAKKPKTYSLTENNTFHNQNQLTVIF